MLTFRRCLTLAAAAAMIVGLRESGLAQEKPGEVTATSPDKKVMAAAKGKMVSFFDVDSGKQIRQLAGHQGKVTALAFSPDGKYFASGSEDQTVNLWDVASGKLFAKMAGHKAAVTSLAFSPDGKSLVTQVPAKKAMTWEVPTGKLIKK